MATIKINWCEGKTIPTNNKLKNKQKIRKIINWRRILFFPASKLEKLSRTSKLFPKQVFRRFRGMQPVQFLSDTFFKNAMQQEVHEVEALRFCILQVRDFGLLQTNLLLSSRLYSSTHPDTSFFWFQHYTYEWALHSS